ncbi:NfeD family protein [Bacteroidota bacterium]
MFEINPSWFQFPPWLNVIIVVSIIAFIAASIYYGIRAHQSQALSGREELVGKSAEVITALAPKGEVFIQGELWKAILDEGQAQPGEEVLITKVDGLKLWATKK